MWRSLGTSPVIKFSYTPNVVMAVRRPIAVGRESVCTTQTSVNREGLSQIAITHIGQQLSTHIYSLRRVRDEVEVSDEVEVGVVG